MLVLGLYVLRDGRGPKPNSTTLCVVQELLITLRHGNKEHDYKSFMEMQLQLPNTIR